MKWIIGRAVKALAFQHVNNGGNELKLRENVQERNALRCMISTGPGKRAELQFGEAAEVPQSLIAIHQLRAFFLLFLGGEWR